MDILRQRKSLAFKSLLVVCLIFFMPILPQAGESILLPQNLNAKAMVIKSERGGLWEKSLIVQFPERRRVLSTNDGFIDAMAVVNHSAHPELWKRVCQEMKTKDEVGGKVYSRKIIKERNAESLGIRSEDIAQMATAADMDNLAVTTKTFKPFIVTALVTAGAKTNALRAGIDEGTHIEGEVPKGTVNIIILTNARLTDGALARAIVTVTEAKTAAFEDLKVPSSYTKNVQATGTGTDSVIVVSGTTGPKVTYTGGHSSIGELIGKAVYEAVVEALGKQNGFRKSN
ncbi:MAG: adenosylcobinamide amidohydrolase [Thermodesulfovibrionales bacterium]|nr:adenosylcobinamide amidohydrolase [Thermodesulfovibrionales bacterium]